MNWNETFDVVVIGSGAAALTGALTSGLSGQRTVVIEKTQYFGGTSAYSGGCIWVPGNAVAEDAGVIDSIALGLEYFSAVVGDRTDSELQRAYLETGPQMISLLTHQAGFEFDYLPFPDYFDAPGRVPNGRGIMAKPLAAGELGDRLHQLRPTVAADQFGKSVDRSTLVGGQALIARLLKALDGLANVTLLTNTAMTSLVEEDDRVVGVVVQRDDEELSFRAGRGVLVAAGGFEGDAAMRKEYQGVPTAQWTSSSLDASTGDALRALQQVDAATDLLTDSWWCPGMLFPNGRAVFTLGLNGGIFVDETGKRFANESLPYDQMGRKLLPKLLADGALNVWFVFDDRFDAPPAIVDPAPDREQFIEAGLWRSAPTLRELAKLIDVEPDSLYETVSRFNEFADTGDDVDFGRGTDPFDLFFAYGNDGPNPALVPIRDAPFHAVKIVLGDLGTKGGAKFDADGRVLKASGEPIAGLYAAGNSTASVSGSVYPSGGVPLGSGMSFAYRAAKAMAAEGITSAEGVSSVVGSVGDL